MTAGAARSWRGAPVVRIAGVVLGAACLAAAVAGCAPDEPLSDPEGVSVALYQTRSDVAAGVLEIQVVNDGPTPLVVTRAAYRGPEFVEALIWQGTGSTVHAGHRLDLPVALVDVSCDPRSTHAATVEITIVRDGREHTVTRTPSDPFGQVERLREEGCFAASLAELGELRITRLDPPDAAGSAAHLVFEADPTGDSGYTVTAARSTTLVSPAVDGVGRDEAPLTWRVAASSNQWALPIVPTRCDPHAVLEDKQGTLIPLSIERDDGVTGRLVVAASAEIRAQILDYVASSCGFSS